MKVSTFTLLFIGLTISLTGCATKKQSDVSVLKAQVAQLDAALRESQAQNQALQAQLTPQPQRSIPVFTGSTYRTPSGFELPASDIQKALKGAGYYTGPVDGKIGPSSREAIRNFQRDNGMTPDGVCGKQTWSKLKTYLS